MKLLGIVFVFLCAVASATKHPLEGHQVWKLDIRNENKETDVAKVTIMNELRSSGMVDFLGSNKKSFTIRILPSQIEPMEKFVRENNLKKKIVTSNLAVKVKKDYQKHLRASAKNVCTRSSCPKAFHDQYMQFEETEWYLQNLARSHPDRTYLEVIGQTEEGRNIWLLHIREPNNQPAKAIWIEAGIHAREWVSSAVTLNLIDYILENNLDMAGFEFYIAPLSNPDGYEYSRTVDRFWRKNRASIPGTTCYGVDLNRNWDYKWGVGASPDPCSDVFKGVRPFSEPETAALSTAMKRISNLKMVLSMHSYGQKVLYPWGWTLTPPRDINALVRAANAFASSATFKKTPKYTHENSASGLYFASGSTDDWAKNDLNLNYSYTIELPDKGSYGFLLPPVKIASTAGEVWKGLKAMVTEIQ